MSLEIGGKLRLVREQARLTQRQLAKKVGVTNATISLMESGRTNPSVGNLKRVLDGIPMSMAEFFAMDGHGDAGKAQVFFPAHELVEIARGGVSYRQVGANLTDKALQILHERYSPGSDSGKIPLRHDSEEGGIVISGTIELQVGTQVRMLRGGDAYYFDSHIPHRFRNVGDEECVIVSVCTPPSV